MNWPAEPDQRGVPHKAKPFGSANDRVVWESWKAVFELLQPKEAPPSSWDKYAGHTPCSGAKMLEDGGKEKILASFSKMDPQLEDLNQAGEGAGDERGPLIDTNGEFVRYETRMNRVLYDYLKEKEYYRSEKLPQPDDKRGKIDFPEGSILVKAAWRVLPKDESVRRRYYQSEAWLLDPKTKQCAKALMGLVGLHIVHKTRSQPKWIWSTFEHVDNLPTDTQKPEKEKSYTFFDVKAGFPDALRDIGYSVNGKATIPLCIHRGIDLRDVPRTPVQVVRRNPIPASTEATNALYRAHNQIKDTVWANYQLVATQWPNRRGAPSKMPDPSREAANVTMETYT